MNNHSILSLLLWIGATLIACSQARVDHESNEYSYHAHHLKDQAPTDASFRHRYHALLRSPNPLFGVMSKYFLRNRAQEHREKRQITLNNQPIKALPKRQSVQPIRLYRRVRQPQQVYPNSNTNYPRYFYQYPNYSNIISPRQSYNQQQSIGRNNKWNAGTVVPTYNIYGKPQSLNNYYSNNADYYQKLNAVRRQNGINKRQDNGNSNSRKANTNTKANGSNKQGKRRFKPSLVQS